MNVPSVVLCFGVQYISKFELLVWLPEDGTQQPDWYVFVFVFDCASCWSYKIN